MAGAACFCALTLVIQAETGAAQTAGPRGTIDRIVVEGAQRIEPSTIESYLTVTPGEPFAPAALDDSLRSLFDTGLFADVVLRQEGDTLVISVVENPIINRIAFEGNDDIDAEDLEAEVQLRPRVVYTRTRVQEDVSRIQELYRREGRFAATVEPKVIPLEQNRVDLVFEIDEGPLTRVRRITFIGNEAFSDSRLESEIQTEEAGYFGFLNLFGRSDTYDPDRLAFDRELLRRFYLEEGYADFRVVSAVAELTPDNEAFLITFTVEEGELYSFGDIDVVSQLPDLDTEQLRELIISEPGSDYSSVAVEQSIDALTEAVANQQYAFVDVQPVVSRNRAERLINVTYEIGEGPRVFVERIEIQGNIRTVDSVIRREMELIEGDPFNAARLRQSEARIRDLGFFETVEVTAVEGSQPDRTVIIVEVEETSTGELSFGAGFSSIDGPLGSISITERNLLGRGQRLRIAGALSGNTTELDLSFTEPYFLGRDLSAGFDIFHITRDNQDESSFDEALTGFGLRFGYPLGRHLRQTVRYRLENTELQDIDEDASRFIREQEGTTLTSLIGHELVYDRLDSRLEPSDGYILRLSNDVAGLGGDTQFFRTVVSGGTFFTILPDTVLNISAETGYIVGLGEDVRINDRFFIGGNNFRGFSRAGLGPRDIDTDDALGGNWYGIGTVELAFPLGLPEELGLRGRTFTDFGTLSGIDDEGPEIVDEASLRMSVGVGLSWRSPFGPIQIDFAVPVLKEDFDEEETIRFSFGTRF
ncbi:MAG: outer membrane protein assembly factor BamA [Alphaproteobacteria bacterium]|nr:outer membrane protein assembly factor BamA [Alphaproteobacteria bacterium]